ncbi:integrase [Rhodanobacter sp. FW510-R12]|uniref:DNA-binding protein n=1 Tax=unclassified Rhodanobacter TaxID=2621553 RepID=UPI0007AA3F3F|nr:MULTISPECIES: DNA-binding protein [unclassified Rhodanobacter]KZC17509.1 integrase [Rhodanobacter sp. FW104-R8]KZC28403.1 integrase [Rhodanobacter sp. FW510-T8]KZC32430.1 integrase [Rhodanobacter sp. FW510-R10]
MSRVSDTRQRTREAAAQLVAGGKRSHEITVDQIYAAIQQGSRTTINDELKLWKDERAKADAVGADLPPAIADAMRSLWVAAVEQGEKVFNEHRQALESDLEAQRRAYDDVAVERDAAQATVHQLQHEVSQLREQGIEVQQQLTRETEAKRDALGQVQALQHEVAAVRTDMAQQREAALQAHDRLTAEFQATIAARDAAFQVERDKSNERMEAAQARMLQETDAAREGQRHAEQQLAKLRQRSEDQQTSLTELRLDMARLRRELAEGEARLAAVATITGERDQLALELAGARGQVSGLKAALQSAEARAVAAENQLTMAHKRRQSKQK